MNKQLERRFFAMPPTLETREEGKPTIIAGYAALFNVRTVIWGMWEESIAPGAFTRAIKDKHDTRSLFNHDANWVLGRTKNGTLTLREDQTGLWTETTPPDTQQARDVVENIRNGNVDQMSFAFIPKETQWTFSEKRGEMDHCEILDLDLYDISPVTYPAYQETSVGLRSALQEVQKAAEDSYRQARAQWEDRNRPSEPITIISPEPYILKVRTLRAAF
jgi:HK97 family phage prohead protease